jgi:hypothetical protein
MISKPLFKTTISALGLLATLQLFVGAIYTLMWFTDMKIIFNLICGIAGISGAFMFMWFYLTLKFVLNYMENNGYEMEEEF